GKSGNGRAVDNVVFLDTTDQFFAYGGIGIYRRENESITMTQNPLIITVTRNDPVTPDSAAAPSDSLVTDTLAQQPIPTRDTTVQHIAAPDSLPAAPAIDSIYMTADTLFSQVIQLKAYVPLQFNLDREGGELLTPEDAGEDFTLDSLGETAFTDDFSEPDTGLVQVLPDSL